MKMTWGRDDATLWAVVAATVRPLKGRTAFKTEPSTPESVAAPTPITAGAGYRSFPPAPLPAPRARRSTAPLPPDPIEPNRRRRLDLGRETMAATLDLHGLGRDTARDRLIGFILGKSADGARAVLVITGKGPRNDGLLRRRVPEWLAEAPLRDLVAGLSEAHPKRGGAGALYVVLRRR